MLTANSVTIRLIDPSGSSSDLPKFACIRPPQHTDNRSFWDRELVFEEVPLNPDVPVSVSCIA